MIKVYGPYIGQNGRKNVVIHDTSTGKKGSKSYARHLMEQHLGRQLAPWEHVDHKDNDPTNDDIDNLQILTQKQNNSKSAKPVEYGVFICQVCNSEFELLMYIYRGGQIKRKYKGPFCSLSCGSKSKAIRGIVTVEPIGIIFRKGPHLGHSNDKIPYKDME